MERLDIHPEALNALSHGHEFEQTLGDSGGQRSLACCSPWAHKEADTTERLNNNTRITCLLSLDFTVQGKISPR